MGRLRIGLTGGPGTGKSTVADIFRRYGVAVISADEIGHWLIEKNERVKRAIKKLLGNDVYDSLGKPKRPKIASLVFGDQELLKKFNAIVHPPLIAEIKRQLNRASRNKTGKLIVVDAALIFEWGIADLFDYIIAVDAPLKLRISRYKKLRGKGGFLRKRIAVQMPQKDKNALADYVIVNDGGLKRLERAVKNIIDDLKKTKALTGVEKSSFRGVWSNKK